MISDLTYKVVSYSDLTTVNGDDCVDWAIEMLQLGHDTPSLLILAGLTKPTNQFEVRDYLKRALGELELDEKTGDNATLSYSSYYITKIAKGENVDASLYYFRTTPRFEAPTGEYAWINDTLFICIGERNTNSVVLKVWRIL